MVGVDIPWIGGQYTMGRGVDIPRVEGIDITWVGARYTMYRVVIMPWVGRSIYVGSGVDISWVGSRYTMGSGS